MAETRPTFQHEAVKLRDRSPDYRLALLLLTLALVALPSCKRTAPKTGHASARSGQSLRQLRQIWRLPGFEATHSLLSVVPTGDVFLVVGQVSEQAWNLAAIDIRRGKVLWRSPLANRAGIALSVTGDKAVVHGQDRNVTAYDLATGRQAWATKLDCEIQEGELTGVGAKVAVGRGERGGPGSTEKWQVELLGLDLETGAVIWRRPQPDPFGHYHFVDGKLLAYARETRPVDTFDTKASRWAARASRVLPRSILGGPPLQVVKDPNALAGSEESEWVIVDVLTGKTLPPTVLGTAPGKASLLGPDPLLLAQPMFPGSVSVYGQDFAFFTQSRKGATPRRADRHRTCSPQFGIGCVPTPLHSLTRVLRADRMFRIDCGEIVEFSPTTEEALGTWPITGGRDFFEPWLAALDVQGTRVTAVIASRHPREVGRVVTFLGQASPIISKAPGIDPDLVGLSEGVLVAQEGLHLGGPVDPRDPSQKQAKALVGYSLLQPGPEDTAPEDPDLERLRRMISGHGSVEPVMCEAWRSQFDEGFTATLKAMPRWEDHIAQLLHDRDLHVQAAAFAAAAHFRTPSLVAALLRIIEPLPRLDTGTRSPDKIWWQEVRERQQWTRVAAAMALVEVKHVPAMRPLAAMVAEEPLPYYDHVADCAAIVAPVCAWIGRSDLPEAKAAIAEYDRLKSQPGAWQALCARPRHSP